MMQTIRISKFIPNRLLSKVKHKCIAASKHGTSIAPMLMVLVILGLGACKSDKKAAQATNNKIETSTQNSSGIGELKNNSTYTLKQGLGKGLCRLKGKIASLEAKNDGGYDHYRFEILRHMGQEGTFSGYRPKAGETMLLKVKHGESNKVIENGTVLVVDAKTYASANTSKSPNEAVASSYKTSSDK